jgi:hypothetical protein
MADHRVSIFPRDNDALFDVPESSKNPGTGIWLYGSNQGFNQVWDFYLQGDGSWVIYNEASGLVLDMANSSTDDGTQVIQWGNTDGDNQKWLLLDDSGNQLRNIEDVAHVQIVNKHSGKPLGINSPVGLESPVVQNGSINRLTLVKR